MASMVTGQMSAARGRSHVAAKLVLAHTVVNADTAGLSGLLRDPAGCVGPQ